MHPFFRPRRGRTSVPDSTPYQRAGQVWDDRMGLSLAHARNWRRMALANLVMAGFLGAGWWVQADRAVVLPFVVEVSDWGETQRITAIGGRYEPNDAQVGHALAGWIRDVRSKSIDPIVLRQNWLRAYDLLTGVSFPVAAGPGVQHEPWIEGDRVIWINEAGGSRQIEWTTIPEPASFALLLASVMIWGGRGRRGQHHNSWC